jgi:allantoicase
LQLENVENTVFTHVKMTIYPDGGVKRIRVIGLKADSVVAPSLDAVAAEDASIPLSISPSTVPPTPQVTTIPVLPLTPEAFSPFGQVIQGYSDLTAAPKGTKITPANAGTANKFHKLTLLSSSYPANSNATAGISVYRCQPLANISPDGLSPLTVLERHPYTNQAFVPMGRGVAEGLKETSDRYLVVVAHNGADDKPDLKTLRAFWASTAQGIVYNAGLWHQPMTVLGKVSLYCDSTASMTLTNCPQALDLACVETQIGDGSAADCEILELDTSEHIYKLRLGGLV